MSELWDRIARIVVERPRWVLAVSLLVVALPALAVPTMELTYDSVDQLPDDAPSVQGIELLGEHFPSGAISPVIIVVEDDEPVTQARSLRALGDMSRNLQRLDHVASVRSVAMPTNGELPDVAGTEQLAQVGELGDRLQEAADGASQLAGGLDDLLAGLQEVDTRLPELEGGITEAVDGVGRLLEGARAAADGTSQLVDGARRLQQGADELVTGLAEARDGAARLRDDVAVPADESVREAWDAIDGFTLGLVDPQYRRAARAIGETYGRITGEDPRTGEQVDPAYDGLVAALDELTAGLDEAADGAAQLRDGAGRLTDGLVELDDGLTQLVGGLEQLDAGLTEAQPGVERLQEGIDQLADGAQRLADGADDLASGLVSGVQTIEDSGFSQLSPVGTGDVETGPFVVTPGLYDALPEVRDQLEFFLADDATRTRVLVGLDQQAFDSTSLDAITDIRDVARLSLQSSPLQDAEVVATGPTASVSEMNDAAERDLPLIIIAVLLGVFTVLVILLRAVVAPVYMVLSVLLSFVSALGVTTIVYQHLGSSPGIVWYLPAFLYVILVALGADYTIYLMSRVREEAERTDTRTAVGRASRATGSVISSAGLILAGTFSALLFAPMVPLAQLGFAVTVGVLLDTFVVRSFLVPSVAVLLGRANWWPSKRAQRA